MNVQEQEEVDFANGAASEQQNCYTEAGMEAARLASLVKETGEGPILLTVKYPYHCKSTDAFVGMFVCQLTRFVNRDLAEAYVQQHREEECDYEITPPIARPAPPSPDWGTEVPF